MTTYKELKEQLIDMGFEEDEVLSEGEYARLIRNAINRAQDVIYTSVCIPIESFLLLFDNDWEATDEKHIDSPTKIKSDTKETFNIGLSDYVMPLLPLLTAYYVWLDDDLTKATYYYNQYDSMKMELMNAAQRPKMARIVGGI